MVIFPGLFQELYKRSSQTWYNEIYYQQLAERGTLHMAMFESLSKRLEGIFTSLSGQGKITEEDLNVALKEVRMALLEADVNLKVVRQFVERVKEKAIGANVMGSLSPAQQVLSIVHDELIEVLGGSD